MLVCFGCVTGLTLVALYLAHESYTASHLSQRRLQVRLQAGSSFGPMAGVHQPHQPNEHLPVHGLRTRLDDFDPAVPTPLARPAQQVAREWFVGEPSREQKLDRVLDAETMKRRQVPRKITAPATSLARMFRRRA